MISITPGGRTHCPQIEPLTDQTHRASLWSGPAQDFLSEQGGNVSVSNEQLTITGNYASQAFVRISGPVYSSPLKP